MHMTWSITYKHHTTPSPHIKWSFLIQPIIITLIIHFFWTTMKNSPLCYFFPHSFDEWSWSWYQVLLMPSEPVWVQEAWTRWLSTVMTLWLRTTVPPFCKSSMSLIQLPRWYVIDYIFTQFFSHMFFLSPSLWSSLTTFFVFSPIFFSQMITTTKKTTTTQTQFRYTVGRVVQGTGYRGWWRYHIRSCHGRRPPGLLPKVDDQGHPSHRHLRLVQVGHW